ncbi:hypothetical protein EJ06DRAFT_388816 [Trichodelitschia bisporula]|uniref:Uncharacterized protein n=1 Tax=Trichodelitschia bisporula TaxID=703511 RepID=A0A6G1HZR0_9PEZI|nr:hypothetical protein EJ06DRAFT_388816 [Trichodelitschia bisporula]
MSLGRARRLCYFAFRFGTSMIPAFSNIAAHALFFTFRPALCRYSHSAAQLDCHAVEGAPQLPTHITSTCWYAMNNVCCLILPPEQVSSPSALCAFTLRQAVVLR